MALAMLIAYNVSVRLHSPLTLLVVLVLAIALPWLLRNSFRFRLYNSSWRGTRFHFRGSVGGSYRVFLLNGFLTLITLYVMAPFMHQRLKAYQHDNSWFGRTRCSFHAAGRSVLPDLPAVAAGDGGGLYNRVHFVGSRGHARCRRASAKAWRPR